MVILPYLLSVLTLPFSVGASPSDKVFMSFGESVRAECREDWSRNLIALPQASQLMLDPQHPNVAILSGFVTLHFLDAIDQLPAYVDTLALELPRGGHALRDSRSPRGFAKKVSRRTSG